MPVYDMTGLFTAGSNEGPLEAPRTRLVQRSLDSLGDVQRCLNDHGPEDNEICIVLTPNAPCIGTLLHQVPAGFHVLYQKCGADQGGFLAPGGHWCWPAWYTISHIVSKQVFTFNAKPKSCPTRDAVFVDVNLSINLAIASDYDRVKAFVFGLGAERLDSYLVMQVEESIRTLVYGVTHDKVNDLRSEFATEMLTTLQSKLTPLGVDVRNVKVTDVALPTELQKRLESTTAFKTRINEEKKNHEHKLQQLDNSHEQKNAEIRQKFQIKIQQLTAEADRYEVNMDEKMAAASSQRIVASEGAMGAREVAVTKAKGEIEVARFEGRTEKELIVSTAQIDADEKMRNAMVDNKTKVTEATATESMSANLAAARLAEAEAMGKAAEKTENMKVFEQKMRLGDLDCELASKGRFLLDGTNGGGEVINSFVAIRHILQPGAQDKMVR